jgi:hypothetical protein
MDKMIILPAPLLKAMAGKIGNVTIQRKGTHLSLRQRPPLPIDTSPATTLWRKNVATAARWWLDLCQDQRNDFGVRQTKKHLSPWLAFTQYTANEIQSLTPPTFMVPQTSVAKLLNLHWWSGAPKGAIVPLWDHVEPHQDHYVLAMVGQLELEEDYPRKLRIVSRGIVNISQHSIQITKLVPGANYMVSLISEYATPLYHSQALTGFHEATP